MSNGLPRIRIDLEKCRNNAGEVISRCHEMGVAVAGVIKGANGLVPVARAFAGSGADFIASSRLSQLAHLADEGIDLPRMLIRIPMMSETEDAVRHSEIALVSEISVIKALASEARRQGKIYAVILMDDIGDLREGFWEPDDMLEAADEAEKEDGIYLAGIGTNIGCYGSVAATAEKLRELTSDAEAVERHIGRRLDYISGGATSSFARVLDGTLPEGINLLRIGEAMLTNHDLPDLYGIDMPFMEKGTFVLEAEIIEVKDKPTHPVGELAFDAFGNSPEYEDRGIRKRALAAIGKADFAYPEELIPRDEGITVVGASSDHTILDVEDAAREIKVGDIVSFDLTYAAMLFLTGSADVNIVYE